MKSDEFSCEEVLKLATYAKAIELILDYGKWKKINGESVWMVPARIKYEIEEMLEELEE
jgi:hypothetical protein